MNPHPLYRVKVDTRALRPEPAFTIVEFDTQEVSGVVITILLARRRKWRRVNRTLARGTPSIVSSGTARMFAYDF